MMLPAVAPRVRNLFKLDFQTGKKCRRLAKFLVLVVWLITIGFQISQHVMFRDEVRALSLSLSGGNVWEMLRTIHGEGHPAVWYLLLRFTHTLFGNQLVLPGMAFFIAFFAVVLLLFRSPFPLPIVVLLLGSDCFLYEYSVMARNYGISALLLFIIAANYNAWRCRGYFIGGLLFLLSNTNVIAAIMTGGFLLFWLLDLLENGGMGVRGVRTNFIANALIAMVGLAVCAFTILPTFNDAAVVDLSQNTVSALVWIAVVNPGMTTPGTLFVGVPSLIASLLLFGATFGLLARPAAFAAALISLLVLSLFSNLASPGSERHALVWFCFCIALYWISWDRIVECIVSKGALRWTIIVRFGCGMFLILVCLQLILGLTRAASAITAGRVESRSADFGHLIGSRPDLAKAIIVAEPEFMAEALPFYINNPIYLIREHKYGNYVHFTKQGQLGSDLGETLNISDNLHNMTGLPVVILMQHKLKNIIPDQVYREGYNWTFRASRQQIADFLTRTSLLAEFGPANYFETYDVYLLNDDR